MEPGANIRHVNNFSTFHLFVVSAVEEATSHFRPSSEEARESRKAGHPCSFIHIGEIEFFAESEPE